MAQGTNPHAIDNDAFARARNVIQRRIENATREQEAAEEATTALQVEFAEKLVESDDLSVLLKRAGVNMAFDSAQVGYDGSAAKGLRESRRKNDHGRRTYDDATPGLSPDQLADEQSKKSSTQLSAESYNAVNRELDRSEIETIDDKALKHLEAEHQKQREAFTALSAQIDFAGLNDKDPKRRAAAETKLNHVEREAEQKAASEHPAERKEGEELQAAIADAMRHDGNPAKLEERQKLERDLFDYQRSVSDYRAKEARGLINAAADGAIDGQQQRPRMPEELAADLHALATEEFTKLTELDGSAMSSTDAKDYRAVAKNMTTLEGAVTAIATQQHAAAVAGSKVDNLSAQTALMADFEKQAKLGTQSAYELAMQPQSGPGATEDGKALEAVQKQLGSSHYDAERAARKAAAAPQAAAPAAAEQVPAQAVAAPPAEAPVAQAPAAAQAQTQETAAQAPAAASAVAESAQPQAATAAPAAAPLSAPSLRGVAAARAQAERDRAASAQAEAPAAQAPQQAEAVQAPAQAGAPAQAQPVAATPSAAAEAPQRALSEGQHQAMGDIKAIMLNRGDSEKEAAMAATVAAGRFKTDRVHVGKVLEQGAAPYKGEKDGKVSPYVKLETAQGPHTVWGVDLPRAMAEGKVKVGDEVALAYQGNELVTVKQKQRDANGQVFGEQDVVTKRATWDMRKLDDVREEAKQQLAAGGEALEPASAEVAAQAAPKAAASYSDAKVESLRAHEAAGSRDSFLADITQKTSKLPPVQEEPEAATEQGGKQKGEGAASANGLAAAPVAAAEQPQHAEAVEPATLSAVGARMKQRNDQRKAEEQARAEAAPASAAAEQPQQAESSHSVAQTAEPAHEQHAEQAPAKLSERLAQRRAQAEPAPALASVAGERRPHEAPVAAAPAAQAPQAAEQKAGQPGAGAEPAQEETFEQKLEALLAKGNGDEALKLLAEHDAQQAQAEKSKTMLDALKKGGLDALREHSQQSEKAAATTAAAPAAAQAGERQAATAAQPQPRQDAPSAQQPAAQDQAQAAAQPNQAAPVSYDRPWFNLPAPRADRGAEQEDSLFDKRLFAEAERAAQSFSPQEKAEISMRAAAGTPNPLQRVEDGGAEARRAAALASRAEAGQKAIAARNGMSDAAKDRLEQDFLTSAAGAKSVVESFDRLGPDRLSERLGARRQASQHAPEHQPAARPKFGA